jgi:hypothetical protein
LDTAIVLVTRDLRVRDNPALREQLRERGGDLTIRIDWRHGSGAGVPALVFRR